MLIDWITARIPLDRLSPEAREAVSAIGDRVQRFCAKSGEVQWTTAAWDSIRSDSHQIAVKVGGDLWMQGSPARVIGNGCTVFGSGASAALDLAGCVERMRSFVSGSLSVSLPPATEWTVSRIDVTGNLALESLDEVLTALSVLKNCEGGRYRVSAKEGNTIYWGGKSKMRRGKAYAKGPHLLHLMKQQTYTGHRYTPAEIETANPLLRLELTIGREFLARHDWTELTPADLEAQWRDYFGRMIGDAEMTNDDLSIQERIARVAPTEGQAKAAYTQWVMIKQNGWEAARNMQSRTTWFRNLKVLRAAGFGDADLSAGQVVSLRRRVMEARMVRSWSELAA